MTSLGVSALMESQSPKQWNWSGGSRPSFERFWQKSMNLTIEGYWRSSEPLVAVDLVDGPGADDAGVGPGGAAVVAGDLDGGDHGELAVGALAVGQVVQPLGEEGLDVGSSGWRCGCRPGRRRSSPGARRAGGSRWGCR